MSTYHFIVWDIGRTKCAAARVVYDTTLTQFKIAQHCTVPLKTVQSLAELTLHIETGLQCSMADVDAICIGASGFYDGETLHHANPYPYPMEFKKLALQQQWAPFAVVHDYTPILCATFTDYLTLPGYVKWLHQGNMDFLGRRVTLGIGTGLGLKDGLLLPNGDFWFGTNEMGHIGISFPPFTQPDFNIRHQELITYLRTEKILKKNEPLTFEKVLSGDGLARLHQFLTRQSLTASEVSALMAAEKAPETLALFAWYLGLFVGTVQLTFMPTGGIWITGGVALNNLAVFDHPHFYQGIHASPAYQAERAVFPLGVLCDPSHAFLGGAFYALKKLLPVREMVSFL